RIVVGYPDLGSNVLPHEYLQRQVQPGRRDLQHQRRAGLGVAEDQHLLRRHPQAGSRRIAAEVDAREHQDAALLQTGLEPIDRRDDGMWRGESDDSGNLTADAHADTRTCYRRNAPGSNLIPRFPARRAQMTGILKIPFLSCGISMLVTLGVLLPRPALAQLAGTPQQVAAQLALERDYPKLHITDSFL